MMSKVMIFHFAACAKEWVWQSERSEDESPSTSLLLQRPDVVELYQNFKTTESKEFTAIHVSVPLYSSAVPN